MIDLPAGYKRVESPCQNNPDLWFSDNDADKDLAKGICGGCPVKIDCRNTAIELGEKNGIWGGTDFSKYAHSRPTDMCRKRKHILPEVRENNQCQECRKETQKAYEEKQRKQKTPRYYEKLKSNNKNRHKNVIGGKCYSGKHTLTEENTKVRPNDGALMCTECLEKRKIRSDSRSGHGRDLHMGSLNGSGMVAFRRLRK